jgi:hypothetical protein
LFCGHTHTRVDPLSPLNKSMWHNIPQEPASHNDIIKLATCRSVELQGGADKELVHERQLLPF